MGGLSFRHSSSGFFGQGCQKSLGNSEKDRFNRAELSSYRPTILIRKSPSEVLEHQKYRREMWLFHGWLRSAEARRELFCLFFMGVLGLGAVFPKTPKTSQRKRFHELKPRVLEEAPKRVNCIFKRFTKNCRIERIPLNGLSRVAISAMIIGSIWFGIYLQPIFEALKR